MNFAMSNMDFATELVSVHEVLDLAGNYAGMVVVIGGKHMYLPSLWLAIAVGIVAAWLLVTVVIETVARRPMVGRVVGFVLTALTMAAGVSLTLWAVMELAVPYQQNRLEFFCLLLAGVAATTLPIIKWAGGVVARNDGDDEDELQRCVRWRRLSRELSKLGLSQREAGL